MSAVSDRSFRNLGALQQTASTSRVLNLVAIEARYGEEAEHRERPFFRNRILNATVLLKHRLRTDERYLFDDNRPTATKVVVPFHRADLRLGGQSVFVGQRNWTTILAEACGDTGDLSRDLMVLEALDLIPSLDPFLLRENLKRHGVEVAACYFAISPADQARMQDFVAREVDRLISLAYRNVAGETYTKKLVELLLASENDDRLEPLRLTLRLDKGNYREGIFCWRGFLYYKWLVNDLEPRLAQVMDEVMRLETTGPRDAELALYIGDARERLQRLMDKQQRQLAKTLRLYDDAFQDLTVHQKPATFRDFLLKAPMMFLNLGDRVGMISHIASFWRYRFPAGKTPSAPLPEACDILQEFEAGLAPAEAVF